MIFRQNIGGEGGGGLKNPNLDARFIVKTNIKNTLVAHSVFADKIATS